MTPVAVTFDPEVQDRLRDAARWRLVGRLFECPSPEWRADIERLALEVDDADLGAAVAAARNEATEGQYHSVFGPGGPAPPREVSYHQTLELGSVMSSLTAYYAAFGYQPATRETPDHVAVETGFMAYLKFKEAFALAAGDREHAAITADAADRFRTDHLANLAAALSDLLANAHLAYLHQAAAALATRVGPRPGPKRLTVINQPFSDDESEFACDA